SPFFVKQDTAYEIDDSRWLERLARTVAQRTHPLVLVHGGGREVSELQRTLGAEPEWREGLRVTTPEALRAVSMVLSGVVNKRLVASVIGAGAAAVGISGEGGPTLEAVPARGGRMGRTGEIARVDDRLLRVLLDAGLVPIVSPVSRGPDGGALNVNADDAAAAVATGLKAERFFMVTNVPGVLADGSTIDRVTAIELERLVSAGVGSGGMVAKLRAAMRAAKSGVREVRIGDLSLFSEPESGTRIVV